MSNVSEVVGAAAMVTAFVVGGPAAPYIFMAGSVVYGVGAQQSARDKAASAKAAATAAANAAFLAGLKDRLATSITTEQYHRTLYGTNKVGGNIVAIFTSGEHDQYKTCVVSFADHQIDSYTNFYVAGKYVGPLDANGWVTAGAFIDLGTLSTTAAFTTTMSLPTSYIPGSVNVYLTPTDSSVASTPVAYTLVGTTLTVATGVNATVSYQYSNSASADSHLDIFPPVIAPNSGSPRLNIQKHLGVPGEAADSYMITKFSTKWNTQYTLEGHAYCVFTLDLRQAEFQGGPPTFQAEIRGKPLYDPRTSTTAYSENNALVLLDYLTGPYMNIPIGNLPIADYIAAANDCDDTVRTGAVYPQSNKRYTFNGVISSNEAPKKILEQIAQSMAGVLEGNSWSVYAGKYRSPVVTLTDADVVGGLSATPGLGYQGTYNTVRGQYVSPATDYVATDFTPYVNSAYKTADGGELSVDGQFPYTNNVTGVYALSRIKMQDSRNGFTLSGDFSYKTWRLRVGDRVYFSSTTLGMNGKIFRVTDKSVKFGTPIKLTLKEDASTLWDQTDAAVVDSTPNTTLTDPFTVLPVIGLTAFSGTSALLRAASGEVMSRILVTWQYSNYKGASMVDVQWRRHVSSNWETVSSSPDNLSTYLTGVIDGEGYVIRAKLRSVSLNVSSDWSYIDHTVIGKSEPPPDVQSFTVNGRLLNWAPVSAPDLAGYVLAFHYGTGTDWGSATPLNSGFITEAPYSLPAAVSGQVTLMVKAIDTTGNESNNAATAFTVLDAPAINNIVQTYDYGANSYPGTLTGGVVSGATIIASAVDSFYQDNDSSLYGVADTDSFYQSATSSYGSVVYITQQYMVTSALAGSKLSLALSTLNSPEILVEYRGTDLTSKYGVDANSFYGADSDSFFTDSVVNWYPWPGQITAKNTLYQFRITLGSNATAQPSIQSLILIVDAPDMLETVNDVTISSSGTVIPYTMAFTQIKNIQATLHANVVGGITVETDKTTLTVKVYNSSHTAVSGASVDILLKGY